MTLILAFGVFTGSAEVISRARVITAAEVALVNQVTDSSMKSITVLETQAVASIMAKVNNQLVVASLQRPHRE